MPAYLPYWHPLCLCVLSLQSVAPISFLRPHQEHALSCSSHSRLPALRDLVVRPSLFPSLDPLTKYCETFLNSVGLSISTTNPATASFSWDLTMGFYSASLSPHLPNPSSTVSASQPGTPWRIQSASSLSSAHSLSRALFALTLRCCPFISDHTERESRSNWKTVEVAILQIGRKKTRSSIKQTQLVHEITWARIHTLKLDMRIRFCSTGTQCPCVGRLCNLNSRQFCF